MGKIFTKVISAFKLDLITQKCTASVRTVRRIVTGILEDIFPALAAKVSTFKSEDRYAVVMLDEMQLTPGLDYDCTTNSIIGKYSSRFLNVALV